MGALAYWGVALIVAAGLGEWLRRQWINDPAGRDRKAWLVAIQRAEDDDGGDPS